MTYIEEVKHDLQDIIVTSVPMLVPAGLFVMQQVRRCLKLWSENAAPTHAHAVQSAST